MTDCCTQNLRESALPRRRRDFLLATMGEIVAAGPLHATSSSGKFTDDLVLLVG